MVMMAPPWIRAVRALSAAAGDAAGGGGHGAAGGEAAGGAGSGAELGDGGAAPWRVLLSPQGARLDDAKVRQLAGRRRLLLLCGRYEGIDERVRLRVVDEEGSIGDYVLSGGELPAMVLIEAVSRQGPGEVKAGGSGRQGQFPARV